MKLSTFRCDGHAVCHANQGPEVHAYELVLDFEGVSGFRARAITVEKTGAPCLKDTLEALSKYTELGTGSDLELLGLSISQHLFKKQSFTTVAAHRHDGTCSL